MFLLEVLIGRSTCLINKMRKRSYYKNGSCSGILPHWDLGRGVPGIKIAFDGKMIRNHSSSMVLNRSFGNLKVCTVDLWTTQFELCGSTYVQIFFNNKYFSTTRSVVDWIWGCRTMATEELHIRRADCKLLADFWLLEGWYPQPPRCSRISCTLFPEKNAHVYIKNFICNFRGFRTPWNVSWIFLCESGKLWERVSPTPTLI